MEAIGFEQLKDYGALVMLFQGGEFMYQLGDYTKTTEYAQKLLHFTQTFKSDNPETQRFCLFWQGFSYIHLAGTYVVQERFEEGEPYALEGARLINELVKVDASYQQAEYEALNVLVGLELKMKKVAEAEHILQQMANMLGVSKNTIHQTRYRLRRKMGNVS